MKYNHGAPVWIAWFMSSFLAGVILLFLIVALESSGGEKIQNAFGAGMAGAILGPSLYKFRKKQESNGDIQMSQAESERARKVSELLISLVKRDEIRGPQSDLTEQDRADMLFAASILARFAQKA